jgi:hypothetical protein
MASAPRWAPLLIGALVAIGIALDLSTHRQLSATTVIEDLPKAPLSPIGPPPHPGPRPTE